MTAKNPETKTIEVSTAVYDKPHSLKTELSEIFHSKISFNEALLVVLSPKIVDYGELFKTELNKNVSSTQKIEKWNLNKVIDEEELFHETGTWKKELPQCREDANGYYRCSTVPMSYCIEHSCNPLKDTKILKGEK